VHIRLSFFLVRGALPGTERQGHEEFLDFQRQSKQVKIVDEFKPAHPQFLSEGNVSQAGGFIQASTEFGDLLQVELDSWGLGKPGGQPSSILILKKKAGLAVGTHDLAEFESVEKANIAKKINYLAYLAGSGFETRCIIHPPYKLNSFQIPSMGWLELLNAGTPPKQTRMSPSENR